MKRWFCALIVSLLVASSCSRYYAPGAAGRGPRLDHENQPTVETIVKNWSQQPIFVDLQGRRLDLVRQFDQVNPSDSLVRVGRSFRNIQVTIAWWCEGCQDKVGYSQEQLLLSLPGLYTGEPLVVTDLMLRNAATQSGILLNVGEPVIYTDDQGNRFALQSGEHVVFTLSSGPLNFFTKPAEPAKGKKKNFVDPYRRYLREYNTIIDMRKKEYSFQGELYDFRIVLKENWWWR